MPKILIFLLFQQDFKLFTTKTGPPKFHRGGDANYEAVLGGTITMNCAVDAEPTPEIVWYRSDTAIYLSDNIRISDDGQVIIIITSFSISFALLAEKIS